MLLMHEILISFTSPRHRDGFFCVSDQKNCTSIKRGGEQMASQTYRVGSLFSGAGGIDLACERAGFTIAWQSEINADANKILAKHWPEEVNYGDITQINPDQLSPVDLVAGGSPCTSFSVAGHRAGLAGESGLFWHFIRIADSQPRAWILWENVPGVLSLDAGWTFALVLWAFTGAYPSVPAGGWHNSGFCTGPKRSIAWHVLDAQHFGVPQRRRRLYLVGHPVDRTDCVEILFDPDSLPRHLAAGRETRQIAPALLASGAGASRPAGIASETDFCIVDEIPGDHCTVDDPPMMPLVVRTGQAGANGFGMSSVAHTLDASGPEAVFAQAVDVRNLRVTPELSGTIQTSGNSLSSINPVIVPDLPDAVQAERPISFTHAPAPTIGIGVAPTLRAMSCDRDGVAIGSKIRRLLPVEAERLMDLPDDWTRWSADGTELSDTARYRLIGNGVAVPVVAWIARRIAWVLTEEKGDR